MHRGGPPRASGFRFFVLLPASARLALAGLAQARRIEHARLAAAEISGTRPRALGDHSRRDGDRGQPALHAREARCRGARRPAVRSHRRERDGARGVDESGRGCANRAPAKSSEIDRRQRGGPAPGSRQGLVFRPPASGGRQNRLAGGSAYHPRPGARRGAAFSGRIHRGRGAEARGVGDSGRCAPGAPSRAGAVPLYGGGALVCRLPRWPAPRDLAACDRRAPRCAGRRAARASESAARL